MGKLVAIRERCMDLDRNMICVKCKTADECPVCLKALEGSVVYVGKCGHAWHLKCQRRLVAFGHHACSLCRCDLGTKNEEESEDEQEEWPDVMLQHVVTQLLGIAYQ